MSAFTMHALAAELHGRESEFGPHSTHASRVKIIKHSAVKALRIVTRQFHKRSESLAHPLL